MTFDSDMLFLFFYIFMLLPWVCFFQTLYLFMHPAFNKAEYLQYLLT